MAKFLKTPLVLSCGIAVLGVGFGALGQWGPCGPASIPAVLSIIFVICGVAVAGVSAAILLCVWLFRTVISRGPAQGKG